MEGHVVVQVEGPDRSVLGLLPVLGEAPDDLGAAGLVVEEGVEHLTAVAETFAVVDEEGVEGTDVTGRGEDERLSVIASGGSSVTFRARRGHQRERGRYGHEAERLSGRLREHCPTSMGTGGRGGDGH